MRTLPMSNFTPHHGVYDQLNEDWTTLSADLVEHWNRYSPELERGRHVGLDGLTITGWLPPVDIGRAVRVPPWPELGLSRRFSKGSWRA